MATALDGGGQPTFDRMLETLLRHRVVEQWRGTDLDDAVLLGAAGLPHSVAWRVSPAQRFAVLIHGRARFGDRNAGAESLDTLSDALDRDGDASLERLSGEFSLVAVDRVRRRVVLATDPLGAMPLYVSSEPGALVFGASVAAVATALGRRLTLDRDAIADYLHFGFPFGDKTLASEIRLLPPATILEFDLDSGLRSTRTYFNARDLFRPNGLPRADYTAAVVAGFQQSVARACEGAPSVGLALSGGLDTRAVLASMMSLGVRPQTYTLGQRGCADQVIGNALARVGSAGHAFFELDESYLTDFLGNLDEMVRLTDGLYMTHGLTELLALKFLRGADYGVLVRGHGGELAKTSLAWPFHTDATVMGMAGPAAFAPYFFERVGYLGSERAVRQVLRSPWSEGVRDRAARSLTASLDGTDLSPADSCAYLYLVEHHRRYTVASLEVFRCLFDVRLPFVDVEFLRTLLGGQPGFRDDTTLHRAIVRAHSRALMGIRNSNTGAPVWAEGRLEWGLDKFNTLFKRLGVYGYRHYHSYDDWMRKMLLDGVRRILLSEQTLDRGVVDRDGLSTVLDEMQAGTADHAYLLQVLLIAELWQRQVMDAAA